MNPTFLTILPKKIFLIIGHKKQDMPKQFQNQGRREKHMIQQNDHRTRYTDIARDTHLVYETQ